MPTITFQFADPTPDGADSPAEGNVRCSLLEPQVVGGKYRSTQEFTVPLASGAAQASLSAGVWHVSVEGVEGVAERWVIVPAAPATIAFTALADVDLLSIDVKPDTTPRWSALESRVLALEDVALTVEADPDHPWAVLLTVAPTPPVVTPPTVTTHPASTTVNAGTAATFTAAASGATSAQWQVNAGSGWSEIPGATGTSYTIPNPQLGISGSQYQCVFTNSAGSVTTDPATLTVVPSGVAAPTITQQPTPSAQVLGSFVNDASPIAAAATGATSQKWQYYQSGATTTPPMSVARPAGWYDVASVGTNRIDNSSSFTVTSATGATLTGIYSGSITGPVRFRVVFTNAGGSTTSSEATIEWNHSD